MVAKIHTPQHSDYLSAGSLRRPLLLGRLLRFVLGILCLSLAWDSFDSSDSAAVSSASWWLAVVLGLLLVNYVVNFGFGLQLKSVPVVASLVLLGGSAAYSQYELGTVLGEPLFSLSRIWLIYVFTHLG
ncbi:MAG: hypothetical protein RL120_14910, partial [Gammaproteobacteria bacterium]